MSLTYTPYDGSAKPFTIGLMPLDLKRWIEPDDALGAYLAEKRRLVTERRDEVFAAEEDTIATQQEALDLLAAHLRDCHDGTHAFDGNTVTVAGVNVDLADPATQPLVRAGSLIEDDLIIMRRKEAGWTLSAAYVAFPSSWLLREKFGRPMDEIHGNVPNFAGGTRNALLINRIFDNLPVEQPVERLNWSINQTDDLFLPVSKKTRPDMATASFTLGERFLRVERQTLRKMPVSGDILFTVRIYVDPIAAIENHPNAAKLASSLAAQLGALDGDQLGYKGLGNQKERLIGLLRQMAASRETA